MNNIVFAEYLWIDGTRPTAQLRSRARVVSVPGNPAPADFPSWGFDGSSTGQASSDNADCLLQPVRVYRDPLRPGHHFLVLCEVLAADGRPHSSNKRIQLRALLDIVAANESPWLGFEQQYTLFESGLPLGFEPGSNPRPQGSHYCAVGGDCIRGRDFVDTHATACVKAGILFYGSNGGGMPGQWEFQVGQRGFRGEDPGALRVADDLWVARYLLYRCGERLGVSVSLDPKPVPGDWAGAGLHTSFSTLSTRNPGLGLAAIYRLIDILEEVHADHLRHYGERLAERLTGRQSTSDFAAFSYGVAHRGASIRIPQSVAQQGQGYLEDRRPGANADPYVVASCLVGAIGRLLSKPGERAA
ncbi:glutamine synthetase beta-grasp domain-containing protein [Haliea sp. E17]|uniref:glutamine synthetase beta-grasp domain-containing protein n=1 Tax=Haliea sp. E17 TaxID=3401576 RepID=UPI003AACF03F